jgi:hypothetical protein
MSKVDKETLERLKKQHRVVVPVEVEDNGEVFCCYLKRPSVETLSMTTKLAKSDEMKAVAAMINQCWIEGDSIIREDGMLLLAVGTEFGQAQKVRASVIKNL